MHFSQLIRSWTASFCLQIKLSSIGFLDTFDLFDSSRAALPENFLQLPLLSFVSVLVRDLP